MKRLWLLAPLFALAACSGTGSSILHEETDWVRARWERPREAAGGGSTLPWLEVERVEGTEPIELVLIAFEDPDLDASADAGARTLEHRAELAAGTSSARVEGLALDAPPPVHWVLWLSSGERVARFELGIGPFGTTQKRY